MTWNIDFHSDFYSEFTEFPTDVRLELLAKLTLLQVFGPNLKRPHVDTLNGSTYTNRSELRFQAADGVWRVAFAFDPSRSAILLVAGDKSGSSENRFYKQLIKIADSRFADHLIKLTEQQTDDN
ncbi:MAG: addiction module toxin RelE [Oscillatoriales cyanobacterium]|uniref:Type II toxin-antitoxin system RelE/ParE family toxin n=1 Tax=Microcoleus anatoxicus PTRS2 TaxID=2705321 RepID=A0ABU8YP95_9CYAN|nr:MAG: addiction module toxin RelE [Oscillatoriales cyanobacterium]TAE03753.1 MAG: addiction module toxin RelE [Oscillatoriales cyanobacterium]